MPRRPRLSITERLARQLRQWEAEDASAVHGHRYTYTVTETWDRCSLVLQNSYRAEARKILRYVRGLRGPDDEPV